MHMTRLARLALIFAAAMLAVAIAVACGGGDDDSGSPEPTTAPTEANGGTGGDGATGEPITIELHDNLFDPKDITVPVNTTVEITVVNKGVAIHNMHVLSADVEGQDFTSDAIVNPGASSTFEVKFTHTGVFDFQCDYHLPEMAGTITVQ